MRNDHPNADNPFARITSLSCEVGSNRIENFCTELFAWSLINSPLFRASVLTALGIDSDALGFECHTQEFYKTPSQITASDKGYFDCTIRTQFPRRFCVFEIKVWS